MTKWGDILSYRASQAQTAWDRRMSVWRARNQGATFVEIARGLGCSRERASQLYAKADFEIKLGTLSPVERYLADGSEINGATEARIKRPLTGDEIAERLRDVAERKMKDDEYVRDLRDMGWSNSWTDRFSRQRKGF